MMDRLAPPGEYYVPWLATFFHDFPHVDLKFQGVNSTFLPDDTRYQEVLLFWSALPILWLILTLIFFLVHYCYRCCQRDVEKKKKVPCLRWTLAIFAILTCAAVGAGFYGNHISHNAVGQCRSAVEDMNGLVGDIQQQVSSLQQEVNQTIEIGLENVRHVFRERAALNGTMRRNLNMMSTTAGVFAENILAGMTDLSTRLASLRLNAVIDLMKQSEFYRWVGLMVLLSWMALIALLVFLALVLSSKCALLIFCAFGVFTMVLCWCSASFHLGFNVGLGDFCVAPNTFIENLHISRSESAVLQYYVVCDEAVAESPFKKDIREATDGLIQANSSLSELILLATRLMPVSEFQRYTSQVSGGLVHVERNLREIVTLVQCQRLHSDYMIGVNAICKTLLPGFSFILLSAVVAGLLFTILVLLASRAWRHFGKRKGYREIEDEDAFVPHGGRTSPSYYRYGGSLPSRPSSLHDAEPPPPPAPAPNAPPAAAAFTRARHGNPREQLSMQRRNTPPPAYNSDEFYRQYNDIGTPEQQRRMAAAEYNRETNA